MKKILTFLTLLVMLSLPFAITSSANSITITAVNDKVLEYKSTHIPITYRGEYYLPYTIFTENELGIQSLDRSDNLILYTTSNVLYIDKYDGQILGTHNTPHTYAGMQRGNEYYVSVPVVCAFFDLNYSLISTKYNFFRITNGTQTMTNYSFSDFAVMKYELTLPKEDESEKPTQDTVQDTTKENQTLKSIYPVFLNTISRQNIENFQNSGTFFITEETFNDTDLLRYAYINDLNIGIYVNTSDSYENTIKYINEVNSMLFQTLGIKTQLLCFSTKHSSEASFLALGYVTKAITHSSLSDSSLTTLTSAVVSINTISKGTTLKNFASKNEIELMKLTLH